MTLPRDKSIELHVTRIVFLKCAVLTLKMLKCFLHKPNHYKCLGSLRLI